MKQPLRSTTETAGISAGDPLPKQPGSLREIHYLFTPDHYLRASASSSLASLRPCVFAFISSETAGISAGDSLPKAGIYQCIT